MFCFLIVYFGEPLSVCFAAFLVVVILLFFHPIAPSNPPRKESLSLIILVIYPLRTKIIKDNKERNAFLLLVLLLHLLLRQLVYNLSSCTRLSLFCVCIGVSVGCVCLSVKVSVKKSALELITKKDLKIKQF